MNGGAATSALQRGSRSSGTASTGRRLARIFSTLLIVVGLLLLADVAATLALAGAGHGGDRPDQAG